MGAPYASVKACSTRKDIPFALNYRENEIRILKLWIRDYVTTAAIITPYNRIPL